MILSDLRRRTIAARLAAPFAYACFAATTAMFLVSIILVWRGASVTIAGSALADVQIPFAMLASSAVGALIVSRHRGLLTGWLFVLAALPGAAFWAALRLAMEAEFIAHTEPPSALLWLGQWLWIPALVGLTALLPLTFPDGRLPSPRWRALAWVAATAVLGLSVVFAFKPGHLDEPFVHRANPLGIEGPLGDLLRALEAPLLLLWIVGMGAGVAAVVVRFRRGSPVERQQLKWLAYAAAVVGVMFAAYSAGYYTIGERATLVLLGPLLGLSLSGLPAAAGLAILRYRLYDIDVLIRRTLVYGALSAALLATYVATVVLAQAVLRPITGGSELAVAVSTLATLALVQPLRVRIQGAVDRRFYRSRYDAASTLDALSARLRDEVDLDAVRADVLDAVRRTLQPAHAGLWLRRAPRNDLRTPRG